MDYLKPAFNTKAKIEALAHELKLEEKEIEWLKAK